MWRRRCSTRHWIGQTCRQPTFDPSGGSNTHSNNIGGPQRHAITAVSGGPTARDHAPIIARPTIRCQHGVLIVGSTILIVLMTGQSAQLPGFRPLTQSDAWHHTEFVT